MYIIYVTEANKLYKRALEKKERGYTINIPERHFIICAFMEENIVRIPTSFLSVEECFFQEYYPANINIGLLPKEAFRGENETFYFEVL